MWTGGGPLLTRARVLIAHDHELVRQGLRAVLRSDRSARVVGEATTGVQVVEQAERLKPDVVIMDLIMPDLDGVEATRRILAANPGTRVLILSAHHAAVMARGASRADVTEYVPHAALTAKLKTAAKTVYAGRSHETFGRVVDRHAQLIAHIPKSRGLVSRVESSRWLDFFPWVTVVKKLETD
jgi:DNA-binding NarL/FixJ family response regulator